MIRVLSKFTKLPSDSIVIDTTSSFGKFRELSPFILAAPPAKNLENLWQFSKVYRQHLNPDGTISSEWYQWRRNGWSDPKAHRYPMGKGAIPMFSFWLGDRLGYVEARKTLYIPEYTKNVVSTSAYAELKKLYLDCEAKGKDLILLDYDAYDHRALGMSLEDVVDNLTKKMGHAFVLAMMLSKVLKLGN